MENMPSLINPMLLTSLLNLSLRASILAAAVVLFRFIFKKAPKWINCLLWGFVGLRLVLPFSFESFAGLLPAKDPVALTADGTAFEFSSAAVNTAVNSRIAPAVTGAAAGTVSSAAGSSQVFIVLLCKIWSIGVIMMLLFAVISCVRLRLKLRASIKESKGVYICDEIKFPFVFGLFRPAVYLPSGLSEEMHSDVMKHETAHLKRFDFVWKPLGFALLCVYWFNPVMWLAYILLCRDIELACDEKVFKEMGKAEIADYSETLLDLAKNRRLITVCPLAFGETGVKGRIKNALSYKKPALWIIITALIACAAVCVCFTASRKSFVYDTVIFACDDAETGNPKWKFYGINDKGIKLLKKTVMPALDADNAERTAAVLGKEKSFYEWKSLEIGPKTQKDKTGQEICDAVMSEFSGVTGFTLYSFDPPHGDSSGNSGGSKYIVSIKTETGGFAFYRYLSGSFSEIGTVSDDTVFSVLSLNASADPAEKAADTDPGSGKPILSTQELTALSEKGSALDWRDFEAYKCTETTPDCWGIVSRIYEIGDGSSFLLQISGTSFEKPADYMVLTAKKWDMSIDIRKSSAAQWVEKFSDGSPELFLDYDWVYRAEADINGDGVKEEFTGERSSGGEIVITGIYLLQNGKRIPFREHPAEYDGIPEELTVFENGTVRSRLYGDGYPVYTYYRTNGGSFTTVKTLTEDYGTYLLREGYDGAETRLNKYEFLKEKDTLEGGGTEFTLNWQAVGKKE